MRPTIIPLIFGWILSVWLPVPGPIRSTAQTISAAARNGVQAVFHTLKPKN